jgi:hypothetical protein
MKKSKLQKSKDDGNSRYWRNKCDKLWADLVKLRDGGHCAVSGETAMLNAHHLFDRARKDTRHELANGIALAPTWHKWSRAISPHRGPVAFFHCLMTNRPKQWAWLLAHIEEQPLQMTYHETYDALVKQLEGMQSLSAKVQAEDEKALPVLQPAPGPLC